MDQNACAECGFTSADLGEFTLHVERHENNDDDDECGGDENAAAGIKIKMEEEKLLLPKGKTTTIKSGGEVSGGGNRQRTTKRQRSGKIGSNIGHRRDQEAEGAMGPKARKRAPPLPLKGGEEKKAGGREEPSDNFVDETTNINEGGEEENMQNHHSSSIMSTNATMLGLADLSRFLNAAATANNSDPSNGAGNFNEDDPEEKEDMDMARQHSATAMMTAAAAAHTSSLSPMSPMDLSSSANHSAPENDCASTLEHFATSSAKRNTSSKRAKRAADNGSSSNSGHRGKITHKCPHCTFTTYMVQHMKSHLRAHDNFVGQMYICDVCGMAFSQKANMHRHRGTHSGVKPYECRFCQKRFFRKDQMQEHSMTHIKTGDDFDCPVFGCDGKFSQHTLLRQHLDQQHAIAANQQAQCKQCTLQFANSRRLLLHYQTKHDEYYSSVSPVPEGQSPVKRLCNTTMAQFPADGTAALPISKRRRSRKRQRQMPASTAADEIAQTAKKRARVSPSSLQLFSHHNGSNGATTSVAPPPPTTAAGGGGYNVEELLKLDCISSSRGASPASTKSSMAGGGTQLQQQQQCTPNGIFSMHSRNPSSQSPAASAAGTMDLFQDHLLRTCSSAALLAQFGAAAAATTTGGGVGITSAAANGFHALQQQQQRSMLLPTDCHREQQQQAATAAAVASAAAAQLFMQTLIFQQQQHNLLTNNNLPLKVEQKQHVEEDKQRTTGNGITKHLPMAKTVPDCRGLILNGYTNNNNSREAKSIDNIKREQCSSPSRNSNNSSRMSSPLKRHQQHRQECATNTTTSCCSSSMAQQQQKQQQPAAAPLLNNNNSKGDASESEGPSAAAAAAAIAMVMMGAEEEQSPSPPQQHAQKTSLEEEGEVCKEEAITPTIDIDSGIGDFVADEIIDGTKLHNNKAQRNLQCAPPPPPLMVAAPSSTTHSPSSSSTASSVSSSSSSTVDGHARRGGHGSNGSGGSATSSMLENSPLKILNGNHLMSSSPSALLNRALLASERLLKEHEAMADEQTGEMDCLHCGLLFSDQTLYLLHKGLHSEADPWRCNLCGQSCIDKYTFTTHMISSDHS